MSEIKASDLRIGNLFLYKDCVYITKVVGDNFISGINKNGFASGEFPIEVIRPLILTEEMLLSYGFRQLDKYTFSKDSIFIHKRKRGFVYGGKSLKKILVDFHKLQNLFYELKDQSLKLKSETL